MSAVPASIADFLNGRRIAVAGVSRNPQSTANAIFRKLRTAGYEVIAVNPKGGTVEGVTCYHDLASAGSGIDGVFAVTSPAAGVDLVRQCADCGIKRIWFHRAFGHGSVSNDAVTEAQARGMTCIAGACPLMYVAPVDPFHRCFRWWMKMTHKLPA